MDASLTAAILGVGVDIVEVSRILRAIEHERFLSRVFTAAECQRFASMGNAPESIAGVFAAKEACAKALGTGFNGFSTKDIEILPGKSKAPLVNLYGGAQKRMLALRGARLHLSISHERAFAIAMAILEGGL